MARRNLSRAVKIMNYIVSGVLAAMATVDFINGNYLMVVADIFIGIAFLVLVCIALVYMGEENPESSPPSQQIDLDKDDAA